MSIIRLSWFVVFVASLAALTGCTTVVMEGGSACPEGMDCNPAQVATLEAAFTPDGPYNGVIVSNEGTLPMVWQYSHMDYEARDVQSPKIAMTFPGDQDCGVFWDSYVMVDCPTWVVEPGETRTFWFDLQGDWQWLRIVGVYLAMDDGSEFPTYPVTNLATEQLFWSNYEQPIE